MEKAALDGATVPNTKENFPLEPYRVEAYTIGQMEDASMDNGKIIKQMASEHLNGLMVKNTLDNS